jgi:GAF domain-containing protein
MIRLITEILDLPRRKKFRLEMRAIFLTIGIIAAFVTSILLKKEVYVWAGLFTFVFLLTSLAEFVLADVLTEKRYPSQTENILEKLEDHLQGVQYQILNCIGKSIESMRGCDKSRISGTFHLVVDIYSQRGDDSEPALVQLTQYRGRLGGKRWRFTDATKGIVGRCLRTGRPEWVNFNSEAEYENRMVTEFGFTKDELSQHTKEARSYWAHPIHSDNKLIGVLYFFSTETQIFPVAVSTDILNSSANEIAAYLAGAEII